MASVSIPTQDSWANSAMLQPHILAYHLLVRMMWLNDVAGFKEEPEYAIGAWGLVCPGGMNYAHN